MNDSRADGPKTNRSGEATRARIIEAAILVMADRGFAAITLQAVAERAGILYGNLTHHYPTRDKLIDALLEALLQRYRSQFTELALAIAQNRDRALGEVVQWLLDDAVRLETGPVFLELWAMANHQPAMARAMEALYDEAVTACFEALGVSVEAATESGLRDALYLLGTVIEGSSAIFSSRKPGADNYRGFRREADAMLTTMLEARLLTARELDARRHPA